MAWIGFLEPTRQEAKTKSQKSGNYLLTLTSYVCYYKKGQAFEPGPLEEQSALITTEPSLQPQARPLLGTYKLSELQFNEHLFLSLPLFPIEDSTDWEKELQQELQEYEVVAESEKRDENWDKEIEKMLQES